MNEIKLLKNQLALDPVQSPESGRSDSEKLKQLRAQVARTQEANEEDSINQIRAITALKETKDLRIQQLEL